MIVVNFSDLWTTSIPKNFPGSPNEVVFKASSIFEVESKAASLGPSLSLAAARTSFVVFFLFVVLNVVLGVSTNFQHFSLLLLTHLVDYLLGIWHMTIWPWRHQKPNLAVVRAGFWSFVSSLITKKLQHWWWSIQKLCR